MRSFDFENTEKISKSVFVHRSRGAFDVKQFLERSPEVEVENRVDDGVQCWIYVAEPRDKVDQLIRRAAGRAERKNDVHQEKGEPADDEYAHYDAWKKYRARQNRYTGKMIGEKLCANYYDLPPWTTFYSSLPSFLLFFSGSVKIIKKSKLGNGLKSKVMSDIKPAVRR